MGAITGTMSLRALDEWLMRAAMAVIALFLLASANYSRRREIT